MTWNVLEESKWLLTYDIADPKRLRKIASISAEYGIRLQQSVYWLDLPREDSRELIQRLEGSMNPQKDDVLLYHLPVGTQVQQQANGCAPTGVMIASAGMAW